LAVSLPELAHYAGYFFDTRILGKRKPLVGGINITSYCNLACKHCPYANPDFLPREHLPLVKVRAMWERFLDNGVRILFMQGGEPVMWRDAEAGWDFDRLVDEAKRHFFKVACVTNAILPITNRCDLVWISVDGSPKYHEAVRGEGSYETMVRNIAESRNPNLHANVTLSKINVADIEDNVANIARQMPRLKAISFNFQIPYPGVEEYALSFEERAEAVDRIVALKKKGHRILNSAGALRLMLKPGWNRTHWLVQLGHPDGTLVDGCGVRLIAPEVCEKCGYGVMAEVQAIYQGKPSSILAGFKLFRVI
jgi:MoaA/NifB/PqqE/SkfB family radical SAM enzyme